MDASIDAPLASTEPDASIPSVSRSTGALSFVPAVPVEARRSNVRRFGDDGALKGAEALLGQHFGPGRSSFDVQTADLTAEGRRVVLVVDATKPPSEAAPFAFVADASGVVWSKDKPAAGILPPVGPSAIAPAARGRVSIAVCDPPTNSVALRLWDSDGSPFADFQVLSVENGCDALSLLYWPGRGWIVAASIVGATRVQLVSENGSPTWPQALDLGARSRKGAVAPAALAADTDDTFVLVQMVQPSAVEGSPYHALAFRYDTRGTAIWPAAVDLGELPRPPASGERVKLSLTKPGVRATLRDGSEIDLRPSGDVSRRGRAPR